MKEYEVTLPLSKKQFVVYADSREEALARVCDFFMHSDLLNPKNESAEAITICLKENTSRTETGDFFESGMDELVKATPGLSDMDRFCETLENLCMDCGYEEESHD